MADSRQSENLGVLCRVLVVALVVLICVGYVEYAYTGKDLDEALYWLQMFTGSAFPTLDGAYRDHPIRFAFGAVFQVMISVGPMLGVLWLLVVVLTDRRRDMFTYANVLADRDAALKLAIKQFMLKNGLRANTGTLKEEIDGLFADTTTEWKDDLAELIGADGAQEFLAELTKAR